MCCTFYLVRFFSPELPGQERVSAGMSCLTLDGPTAAGGAGAEGNDDGTNLETGDWLQVLRAGAPRGVFMPKV